MEDRHISRESFYSISKSIKYLFVFKNISESWNYNVAMKWFAILNKNVARIFQFQWNIWNIPDIFLQYSVLCGWYLLELSDPFIKNENSVLPIFIEKNFNKKFNFVFRKWGVFFKNGNPIFSIKLGQRLPKSFSQLHVKNSRFFLSYFLKKDDWPKAYAGPRLPTLPY